MPVIGTTAFWPPVTVCGWKDQFMLLLHLILRLLDFKWRRNTSIRVCLRANCIMLISKELYYGVGDKIVSYRKSNSHIYKGLVSILTRQ